VKGLKSASLLWSTGGIKGPGILKAVLMRIPPFLFGKSLTLVVKVGIMQMFFNIYKDLKQ
jgi:hypothetical protein